MGVWDLTVICDDCRHCWDVGGTVPEGIDEETFVDAAVADIGACSRCGGSRIGVAVGDDDDE
jgi:hypothetical protein